MLINKHLLLCLLAGLLALSPALAMAKEARNAAVLSPLEAYDMLMRQPENTFLLDVRSREEFARQGHPAEAYNIPWRFASPDLQIIAGESGRPPSAVYKLSPEPNPEFMGVVRSLFKETDYLLIICDNGEQSAQAADALWQADFKNTMQVRNGVWGEKFTSRDNPRLAEKHSANFGKSGLVNGWVYWGLPMSYTLEPRFLYPPDVKRAQNSN